MNSPPVHGGSVGAPTEAAVPIKESACWGGQLTSAVKRTQRERYGVSQEEGEVAVLEVKVNILQVAYFTHRYCYFRLM